MVNLPSVAFPSTFLRGEVTPHASKIIPSYNMAARDTNPYLPTRISKTKRSPVLPKQISETRYSQLRRERSRILGFETTGRQNQPSGSDAVIDPLLVVAMDIGTTYSGYAFSFRHEKDHIHLNQWSEAGVVGQMKTPTCLLLHPDKNVHSFGNEARTHYATLTSLKTHQDWYFFWEFKMSLHSQEEIKGNYKIKEEGGKSLDAQTIFSLSIKWMKDHLMNIIHTYQAGLKDEEIRWVITVPAIWKDSAKKFMKKAAEEAGIKPENLDIALEPEAASLFCQQLQLTREPSQSQTDFQRFPEGTRYMLLDCGGGTVDVTVHEVLKDRQLKELHKASGGHWGGTKVNASFVKFLSSIVGETQFSDFRKEYTSEYLELLGEFENKKRLTKPGSTTPVTIRIAIPLQEALRKCISANTGKPSTLRGRIGMLGDKLRIEPADFESFFQEATSNIVNHARELLQCIPGPIKFILMVGGFSDSPVLQKCIKDAFKDRTEIIIPIDASVCVMKGAVLYGHDPTKISSRKSPFTYGIAMTKPFDSSKHSANKKITLDNEDLCDDVFDKHVEVDQEVKTGEVQKTKTYYPLSDKDTLLPVMLYKSSERNPKYIDDRGCSCAGTFLVKVNPNIGTKYMDRPLEVGIIFGGTDITVEAKEKDGKTHKADFQLDMDQ